MDASPGPETAPGCGPGVGPGPGPDRGPAAAPGSDSGPGPDPDPGHSPAPFSAPAPDAGPLLGLADLDRCVAGCRACPRLVAWREEVARTKRAAFADWTYWGRPVPGFGPSDARLLIVGLAPAAHGGNRTGRMFTGDRSGDVLYQALYDVGLASQPTSVSADDGLELYGVRVTAPVHCAPPDNKPTPGERDTCRHWLVRELRLLRPTLRAVVVLGAFGWQAALPAFAEAGWSVPRPRPVFAHGTRVSLDGLALFGCFHVSQRNTFTGRLTPEMLRDVLREAGEAAGLP